MPIGMPETIDFGMGLLSGGIADRRERKQASKLQDISMEGMRTTADYQYMKNKQYWDETNYDDQVAELKKAGLNSALIYGMGGAGGQSTNISGSHSLPGTKGGGEPQRIMELGIQSELAKAQVELTRAQTQKTETEAKNIEADTTNKPKVGAQLEASTASLTQGINNQKAQEKLTGIQDSLLRNELWEKYESQDDRMQAYSNEAAKGIEEAKQAMIQTGVDQGTAETKINMLKTMAVGEMLKNTLTQAQTDKTRSDIGVNNAEIMQMATEFIQSWPKLDMEQRKTLIIERVGKFHSAPSQRTYDNILKGVNTVAGAVTPGIKITGQPGYNPVTGFTGGWQ